MTYGKDHVAFPNTKLDGTRFSFLTIYLERIACGDSTHVARFYGKEKSVTMVWPLERLLGIIVMQF